MDNFCLRQFNNITSSTSTIDYDPKLFESKINDLYIESLAKNENILKDGYADFCKHIFLENFINLNCNYTKITEDNEVFIKTVYEARTEKELPVLRRFMPESKV